MSERKIDDVQVYIKQTFSNPNIGKTHQISLKEGPRAYRIATIFEILDGKTGRLHHYALRLDAYKVNRDGWIIDENPTWITNQPGELEQLGTFINNVVNGSFSEEEGVFYIVPDETYEMLENVIDSVSRTDIHEKLKVMEIILGDIDSIADRSPEIIENNEQLLKNISVAARMVNYRQAYEKLAELVSRNTRDEHAIQQILTAHPWLFGSEYSALISRRMWTRDDQLDFMLRRSIDGYLEIIEIKTPFPEPLMLYDRSHDSYYPSSRLSPVLGQVMRYIEEVERQRDHIVAQDGYDPLKIRARVIIGRDGDERHQGALRNFNAYLHRIEILTFDQLLKIGERVLNVFEDEMACDTQTDSLQSEDEIPF